MSELSNVQKWLVQSNYLKNIAKNDSKLDFEYKSVPQIQSNAKVTQKPSKITTVSYEQRKNMYSVLSLEPSVKKTYKEVFSMMTSL